MYLIRCLILLLCMFAQVGQAETEFLPTSENVRAAKDLIVNGDRRQNGEPIGNYQKALALLAKQGQMKPYEMLLLAQAYVGMGNAMRNTKPDESQSYFTRAMVTLEQIPLQVKRDFTSGVSQPEAKQNEYVLGESVKVWQQAKDGLPPIS